MAVTIDLKDPSEEIMWENFFGSDGWRKLKRIQEERIAEIKEHAWVNFRAEFGAVAGVAQINCLQSLVDFEADTLQAFAQAKENI